MVSSRATPRVSLAHETTSTLRLVHGKENSLYDEKAVLTGGICLVLDAGLVPIQHIGFELDSDAASHTHVSGGDCAMQGAIMDMYSLPDR